MYIFRNTFYSHTKDAPMFLKAKQMLSGAFPRLTYQHLAARSDPS